MKSSLPLLVLVLACSPGISGGQVLVNSSNYSDLFGPHGSDVTVNPTDALIGLEVGGSESGSLGTYWQAEAEGGASLKIVVGVAETGAQVALNNGELQFNVSNNQASILGALGVGGALDLDWSATATFDKTGSQLLLTPNTTYQLTFDVDGSNGLLNSTLGLFPTFGVELLDGSGNAVDAAGGGTLVNIIGLELLGIVGSPPRSGRAVVQFQTGSTVASGPAGVRFTGSALAGQLCTQHHFMRWAEDTKSAEMDAMVCVRPVSFHRLSQVIFLPLGMEASYPLNVSYLKQHPYEFLETMVGQVDRALQLPPDGLRSGQS